MEYSDGKYLGKKEKVVQERITGPPVPAFIFHIKLIIDNSLWLTYEGDYYHDLAVYAHTENQDSMSFLRYNKLVILGNLGMPCQTSQK